MKNYWPGRLTLFVCLGLAGCSATAIEPEPAAAPLRAETAHGLGDRADVDITAWLKLPRPELAKLGEEWAENVSRQREAVRTQPHLAVLLPRRLPPFTLPGLHQATYSAKVGFSLPPYARPGKADPGLGLHLARLGDREAAVRLIDLADTTTRQRVAAMPDVPNVPIEWTRLVGLVLTFGHLELANGDEEGAALLITVHKQLQKTLDPKLAAGPLGSALLPWGKTALAASADAWRKAGKTTLADDLDRAVAAWGDAPAPAPALAPGAARAEVVALLGAARGKAVICIDTAAVSRAVDLLELPLGGEAVQAVAAFLGGDDRLAELQVVYRPKIDTLYPTLETFAFGLTERGYRAGKAERAGLQRQDFHRDDLRYELVRSERSRAVGGLVRLTAEKPAPVAGRPLGDFGPVHLDRPFEAVRRTVAPALAGPTVTVKQPAILRRLAGAIGVPDPQVAILSRFALPSPLVASYEMRWADDNAVALERILPALWAAFGPGAPADLDEVDGAFAFTWRDDAHRVAFLLPYGDRGPALQAQNVVPADRLAERSAAARANEAADRQARLAAGKADERLPRSPGLLNGRSIAGLKLGQDRKAALAALPQGKAYPRVEGKDGVHFAVLTGPTAEAPYWARQVRLRFDQSDRLAEIRLRYQPLPAVGKRPSLGEELSDEKAGAAEVLPTQWQGLWKDSPLPGKPVTLRWEDDRTVRLYHADAAGMEVVLRDRTAEVGPDGWLPKGVGPFTLGTDRKELEPRAVGHSDGALVFRGPKDSPYEMILVWFSSAEGRETASRVLAVHRERPKTEPKEVGAALSRLWGKDLASLGFLRRERGPTGTSLGAYFWHDDVVRVKASVENTDQGPRLLTEWQSWK